MTVTASIEIPVPEVMDILMSSPHFTDSFTRFVSDEVKALQANEADEHERRIDNIEGAVAGILRRVAALEAADEADEEPLSTLVRWTSSSGSECQLTTNVQSSGEMQFDLSRRSVVGVSSQCYTNLTREGAEHLRARLNLFLDGE